MLLAPALHAGDEAEQLAARWLGSAAKVRTLDVQFVQERKLRALNRPLSRQGRLWYERGGGFRWQIDEPPSLIALQPKGEALRWIDARARQVRYPEGAGAGEKPDPSMELLQSLLAADPAGFKRWFRILDATAADESGWWDLRLDPLDRHISVAIKTITLRVSPDSGALRQFVIALRDGSVLTTRMVAATPGAALPAGIFAFDTSGFEVIKN